MALYILRRFPLPGSTIIPCSSLFPGCSSISCHHHNPLPITIPYSELFPYFPMSVHAAPFSGLFFRTHNTYCVTQNKRSTDVLIMANQGVFLELRITFDWWMRLLCRRKERRLIQLIINLTTPAYLNIS